MIEEVPDILFAQVALTDYLKGQSTIEPLVLDMESIQMLFSATKLSLPGDPDFAMPSRGPIVKDGFLHSVVITFTGDPLLWTAQPEGIGMVGLAPRGKVDAADSQLILSFAHTDPIDSNWYPRTRQTMLDRIQTFINYQADPIERHNAASP